MKAGWQRKRLADFAATVSTGPFGSVLHKSDYVDDGVPLVNPINIVGEHIVPDPTKLIDKATRQRLSSYVLQEGDIVVGRRGEIGRCAVVGANESGWVCGTGSFFIRPLPSIDSQFLAHLIRSDSYREKLEQASTGATMKNLSNSTLSDLVVAIPPLPEQQRIVTLLDVAFDGIATARTHAERNLQNARAIFESHL
jgi:type I restriction enzyme S subunit